MTAHTVTARDGCKLHVQEDGEGPPLVLAHALGTDHRIWEAVIPLLPDYRIIRFDARGHGRSDVPVPPYRMGVLISDAEAVCEALGVREAVFAGVSLGGMIAQGLAVKRSDLVRAVVLSNTGVKFGTAQIWQDRIAAVEAGGLPAVVDGMLMKWFAPDFADMGFWRARVLETAALGYLGTCAAIAGTDMMTPTSGLRLPALVIAGDRDGSTPPDMVRDLADLIPGSRFTLLRGSGHLPMVDAPDGFAAAVRGFLTAIGHQGKICLA